MRTVRNLIVIGCLVALNTWSSADPTTADQVLADVAQKSANLKTYSADMGIQMNMAGMKMTMEGPMQGKDKMVAMTTNMDMMGQKIVMKTTTDKAGIMWMDMDVMGNKQVMKMDMAQATQMQSKMFPGAMPGGAGGQTDPRELADAYKKMFKLELDGKEQLEGTEVYVLHGKMDDEFRKQLSGSGQPMDLGAMMDQVRVKFGVTDGFPRSIEMIGADGVAWMTQTYKNVKLNEKIDDAVFTYTPPPGVQVMDMSEMMKAGAGAAGEAPKTETKP